MKISDIGGEFALIRRITAKTGTSPEVIKGIGDDCAVFRFTDERYLLVTTDMIVENDHFNLEWFSPRRVGMKLMESNVSDIVAMGGRPLYAFLSMSLLETTAVEFVEDFSDGLLTSAGKHGVILAGGDTTHGTEYVFNLTVLGEVEHDRLRLRSMALPGDLIAVTGHLGGSTAGLELLRAGISGYTLDHLEPHSRSAAEGSLIASRAHAMIDVSDGLAPEVTHIAEESGTGAVITFEKIPISDNTRESAKHLGRDPHDFALYGGEDFELVFTITPEKAKALASVFSDFTIVGEIEEKNAGIFLEKDGKKIGLKKGFDHFR
ncbi:MAG: thiamine-phosphate kinase [Spirochaetales bacterium]|nr:thiamine-phosphate kinase [Spirochaetales bacterium]